MAIRLRNVKEDHRDTFTVQDYQASSIASKIVGIAPYDCELVSAKEVHTTAGNHASAVTLNVERLRNTETSGTGDSLLSSGLNLKGTASTVQTGTISADTQDNSTQPIRNRFAAGDRIGLVLSGNSQTLAGMTVTLQFRRISEKAVIGTISASLSPSSSTSPSSSLSPSSSSSPSTSSSLSPSSSNSPSNSPSLSPSSSNSPSNSPSLSPSSSNSPSRSPSTSISPSESPSVSPSESPSESFSLSPSTSQSPSASESFSLSPSTSVSPSGA